MCGSTDTGRLRLTRGATGSVLGISAGDSMPDIGAEIVSEIADGLKIVGGSEIADGLRTAGSFRTVAKGSIKGRVSEARIKTGVKVNSRTAGSFRAGVRYRAKVNSRAAGKFRAAARYRAKVGYRAKVEFRAKVEYRAKVKDRTAGRVEIRIALRAREGTGSAVRLLRGEIKLSPARSPETHLQTVDFDVGSPGAALC